MRRASLEGLRVLFVTLPSQVLPSRSCDEKERAVEAVNLHWSDPMHIECGLHEGRNCVAPHVGIDHNSVKINPLLIQRDPVGASNFYDTKDLDVSGASKRH